MFSLVGVFGPLRGARIDLTQPLLVGRATNAGLQILDDKVSREHCRFVVESTRVCLEDLGGQNGTYVNGERISGSRTLAPGDEIVIGDSLFVFDPDFDVIPARYGEALVRLDASPASPPQPARTLAQITEPTADLAIFTRLAQDLASAANGEIAATLVLRAIEETLSPDRAFVLRVGPDGSAAPVAGKSDLPIVSISKTILQKAAAERQPVILDDAVQNWELKGVRSVRKHGLRSVVVAPIVLGQDVVGFLHADQRSPGAFGLVDAAKLGALASVMAFRFLDPPTFAQVRVPNQRAGTEPPIGKSPSFREVIRLARAAAQVSSSVFLTGETGTGKEEVARFIYESSSRARRPWVAINCAAIPETLAEAELFGSEKGAFTGASVTREGKLEAADGGTFFLDEVADLPVAIQTKLLRVLQERVFYRIGSASPRRVDVRIIAATQRDVEREVKLGKFREDLYYRLNVVRIHIPPLRERSEDIEPIARELLARIAVTVGHANPGLDEDAARILREHSWPGNVRELSNVLERILVMRGRHQVGPITPQEMIAALATLPARAGGVGGTLADKVMALERREIEAALRQARGVKSRAAKALGLSRPTLDKKLGDLGIDIPPEVAEGD